MIWVRGSALCVLVLLLALPAAAQQSALDKSIPRAGARILQLEGGAGEITLTPAGDASEVHVRVDSSGPLPLPRLNASRSGNRLVVSLVSASGAPLIPFVAGTQVTYAVTYPAGMRLDVRATSGRIYIVHPSSALEVYDEDGDVTIDGPRAAITVESAHGNVAVTGAQAPIDLLADDGNVKADIAQGWSGNEVRIEAGNGDISLTVPKGFRAKLDLTSNAGTVHNGFGHSNARSPLIFLYSQKGDVTIGESGS